MRFRKSSWQRAWIAAACAVALTGGAASDPRAADLPAPIAALGLDPAQARLWREGFALERSESFLASNQRYEQLAAAHPESAFLAWRIARNHWRYGERLPFDAKADRRAAYARSLEWAQRSLERDPDCGECVLWAVVARGRLATTVGVIASVPMVKPMAGLIERGIALQPTSRDNEWNTTLGNLYYAASAFYRVAPDGAWVEWVIGARGNKDRALDYIERAIAISPMRVDYRLEHGVVLTCIGVERRDADALTRGRRELESTRTMPRHLGTDAVDQKHADTLLAKPELACGYSRDGFIDLGGVNRASLF
jgi:tetratricopeptide (TPR) repeat protein